MAFLLLIVVLFLSCASVECACPAGWRPHGNNCYLFSTFPETWPTAMEYCRNLHANLVSIDNSVEHQWLREQLSKAHRGDLSSHHLVSYWTSGNDLANLGTWVWANNKPIEYFAWGIGEPNNGRGAQCLGLHSEEQFLYNDDYCDTAKNNYICEMSATDGQFVG